MRTVEVKEVPFFDMFPDGVDISNPPDIEGKYIPFVNQGERAYLSGPSRHVGGFVSCPVCKKWMAITQEEMDAEIRCRCSTSFTLVISS